MYIFFFYIIPLIIILLFGKFRLFAVRSPPTVAGRVSPAADVVGARDVIRLYEPKPSPRAHAAQRARAPGAPHGSRHTLLCCSSSSQVSSSLSSSSSVSSIFRFAIFTILPTSSDISFCVR